MANYQLLKADIDAKVYQNGEQEITGENLNSVLNAMVTTLGAEYQFAGVATTATNPGSPDAKVFYIANGKGTYTNFGGLEVTEDDVVVLYWDSSWHKASTGIASQEKLTELESEVNKYVLCDNSVINGFVKELFFIESIISQINFSHKFSINLYNNYWDGSSYVNGVNFFDETDSTIFDLTILTQEQQTKNIYSKTVGYVLIDKTQFEGQRITKTGITINKNFISQLDFSPAIKSEKVSERENQLRQQLENDELLLTNKERKMLFEKTTGWISDVDGSDVDNAGYWRTGYLLSSELIDLKYVKNNAVALYIFTYDSNKNFIKRADVTSSGKIPAAAIGYYTRFSWRKTDDSDFVLPLVSPQNNGKLDIDLKRGNAGSTVTYSEDITYRLVSRRIEYDTNIDFVITPNVSNLRYYVNYYKNGQYLGETGWISISSKNKVFQQYKDIDFIVIACSYVDNSNVNSGEELFSITCEQKSGITFSYGNYSNGWLPDRIDRLRSNMLRFEHPVYVGVKNTQRVNTSANYWNREYNRYQILLFNDNWDYIGATTEDWTTYEQYIPENTNFIILVSKEGNISMASVFDDVNGLIGISKTKNYLELPKYYFENNYINNKVDFIREKINACAANGDLFILITDVHWDRNEKHSPALIKYIAENIPIERMFNCGDDFDGTELNVFQIFKDGFPHQYYWTTGNHDTGPDTPQNTPNCIVATHLQNIERAVIGDMNNRYYYVDNQQQKIRYIMLNSLNEKLTDDGSIYHYAFDTEQLNWLENIALNVEQGWTILIFTHIVYFAYDQSEPYRWSYPPEGVVPRANFERFISIVNEYNGDGEIAAIFQGDNHQDRIIPLTQENIPSGLTPSNIPVIATACDTGTGWIPGIMPNGPRTPGTIEEQLFDVVILDKTNRKITMVRIGAKAMNGVGMESEDNGVASEYREITY